VTRNEVKCTEFLAALINLCSFPKNSSTAAHGAVNKSRQIR
jgi:hypothetical protein